MRGRVPVRLGLAEIEFLLALMGDELRRLIGHDVVSRSELKLHLVGNRAEVDPLHVDTTDAMFLDPLVAGLST